MADGYTTLNPGIGGDVMDETEVEYGSGPLVRKRPRVVITGEGIDDIVDTTDSIPAGYERGLVVREGSRGQQTSDDSIPIVMASDQMIGKSTVVDFQQSVGVLHGLQGLGHHHHVKAVAGEVTQALVEVLLDHVDAFVQAFGDVVRVDF